MPATAALPERNALIYERSLDLNGLEQPGTPIANLVGYRRGPASYRDAVVFSSSGAPTHATVSNQDAIQLTSAAGVQGISLGGPITAGFNVPLFRRPADWPASWVSRRIYVVEAVVNVTTGPGATLGAFGIHTTVNDLNGSTDSGVEWACGSGINGGNWTARYRRTAAPTVIANVADSGVLANATLRRLGLVFRESVPAVDFYLDGALVFTQGDPVSITGDATVTTKLVSIVTAAGAAGTVLNIFGARFRVFDPDFPLYAADFSGQTPGPA